MIFCERRSQNCEKLWTPFTIVNGDCERGLWTNAPPPPQNDKKLKFVWGNVTWKCLFFLWLSSNLDSNCSPTITTFPRYLTPQNRKSVISLPDSRRQLMSVPANLLLFSRAIGIEPEEGIEERVLLHWISLLNYWIKKIRWRGSLNLHFLFFRSQLKDPFGKIEL